MEFSSGLDGYEEPLWIWMYPFTENPIAVVSVWDVVSLAYSSSGEIVIAFTWLSLEGDISIIDVDSCMVCRSVRVHCGTMYPIVTAMDLSTTGEGFGIVGQRGRQKQAHLLALR